MRAIRRFLVAWAFLSIYLAGGLAGAAAAQDGGAAALADAFSRRAMWTEVSISPDGRRVAAVVEVDGARRIEVFDLENNLASVASARFGDRDIRNLLWLDDRRLYCGLRGETDQLVVLNGGNVTRIEGFRPYVLDIETRDFETITSRRVYPPYAGEYRQGYWRDQDIVLREPQAEGEPLLLMVYRSGHSSGGLLEPEVLAYDPASGDSEVVGSARSNVRYWEVDQQGRVRISYGIDNGGRRTLAILDRTTDRWRDLSDVYTDPARIFRPIAFSANPDVLYVSSNHGGDPGGLYAYTVSTGAMGEVIASHPVYEITGVDLDLEGRLETALAGDVVIPVNEGAKAFWNRISAEFPGKDVFALSRSRDGMRRVVGVNAPDDPGGYHLYDAATDSFRPLQRAQPWLDALALAPMTVTSYPARDGLVIPAHVTLPPGSAAGAPPPFVVMPHGGPWSRDVSDYDPLVQFLAARGYGVLQMNFRGSSGYGAAYTELGAREWGRAMQDDVVDGAQWLVAQGLADPERICIVGWSYGGYSALMGAVRDDQTFRCSASIAGVSDLINLLTWIRSDVYARRIGRAWRDREELRANSPLQRVEDINIPVFLAHGRMDEVVTWEQTQRLHNELTRLGQLPMTLVFNQGDHSLSRPQDRKQLYEALDGFLAQSLKPGG